MTIQDIATIRFTDTQSGNEDLAIIRIVKEEIALCLSQEDNGDVEIFFQIQEGKLLVEALQRAISAIEGQKTG